MAEECPILGRLIYEYKQSRGTGPLFHDVHVTLDGIREGDQGGNSRKVQLMRSFYCIDVLRWGTFGSTWHPNGDPIFGCHLNAPVPRTREGLNLLIVDAHEIEKASAVVGMETSFAISSGRSSADSSLIKRRVEGAASGAHLIIEACEFLRPRMKNRGSLERMGYFLSTALKQQSSELVVEHAKNLSNITEEHAIVWKP
jgi:hypothetical protein